MIGLLQRIGLTALARLDPETAHHLTLMALKTGLAPRGAARPSKRLETVIGPLTFPNPVGTAAGFDKNAEAVDAVLRHGFGFAEIGSVTPKPQPGNARPRVFRLPDHQAVINRYGFNNDGHDRVHLRLGAAGARGIVGVNVGANKDSFDRIADYISGLRRFADCACYFTVNISSPNTPGLRDLQSRKNLQDLLDAIDAERADINAAAGRIVPVFLKIAPDLTEADLEELCAVVASSSIDGLVISNTTLSRAGVRGDRNADQQGGLSGKPLFERATIVLAKARRLVGPALPIIGVGGISDADSAWRKITAGANLLQVYTGLVYRGPALLDDILTGFEARLSADGFESLGDAVGTDNAAWAARPIPPVA